MLNRVHIIFNNMAAFVKSPMPGKLQRLIGQLKIALLSPFAKALQIKSVRVLGMRIEAFGFSNVKGLYEEIFIKGDYYFKANKKNPVILDCGANIGVATQFFKWLYPESIVYAFEPEKKTFEMLKVNTQTIRGVNLYNAALWDSDGKIDFYIGEKPGSQMMSANKERMIKNKITVDSLSLSKFIGNKRIDFVKLDIEGSEMRVVSDLVRTGTIKRINELIIEYHHKIGKENSCLSEFLSLLEGSGFEYQISAMCIPISSTEKYQDITIHAYRRNN